MSPDSVGNMQLLCRSAEYWALFFARRGAIATSRCGLLSREAPELR